MTHTHSRKHYELLVGLDWLSSRGKPRRGEAGDVVSGLPVRSIPWLLEQGLIRLPDTDSDPAPKEGAAS